MKKVKIIVYAIAGGLASVGGVIVTPRLNSAPPNAGFSYELDAMAAVVIGGTVLGAAIIGVLNNGLMLLDVSPFWQQVVKEGVILLAVIIDKSNSNNQ